MMAQSGGASISMVVRDLTDELWAARGWPHGVDGVGVFAECAFGIGRLVLDLGMDIDKVQDLLVGLDADLNPREPGCVMIHLQPHIDRLAAEAAAVPEDERRLPFFECALALATETWHAKGWSADGWERGLWEFAWGLAYPLHDFGLSTNEVRGAAMRLPENLDVHTPGRISLALGEAWCAMSRDAGVGVWLDLQMGAGAE